MTEYNKIEQDDKKVLAKIKKGNLTSRQSVLVIDGILKDYKNIHRVYVKREGVSVDLLTITTNREKLKSLLLEEDIFTDPEFAKNIGVIIIDITSSVIKQDNELLEFERIEEECILEENKLPAIFEEEVDGSNTEELQVSAEGQAEAEIDPLTVTKSPLTKTYRRLNDWYRIGIKWSYIYCHCSCRNP